jgi:peptidoglycan/LPS O-acetylase OafA/YrhL
MTSVLSIIFLNGVYLTFFDNSGYIFNLAITGLHKIAENGADEKIGDAWLIIIPGLIIPALSLIAIFLFKRRDHQLILVRILMLFILIFIAASLVYTFYIISKYDADRGNWYKLLVPVFQFLLVILAIRGIKRDDDLVKSYDRLR